MDRDTSTFLRIYLMGLLVLGCFGNVLKSTSAEQHLVSQFDWEFWRLLFSCKDEKPFGGHGSDTKARFNTSAAAKFAGNSCEDPLEAESGFFVLPSSPHSGGSKLIAECRASLVLQQDEHINAGVQRMPAEVQQSSSRVIISQKFNSNSSFVKSPHADILVACGGCIMISCAFLCPCLQHKRKNDKDLQFKEIPSNSMSTSFGENSQGVSASSSSTTYGSSSQQGTEKYYGGRAFTLDELKKATGNFSPTFQLGQGGSGVVYKGTLMDGTIVAIKRSKRKIHDAHQSAEFRNEVDMLLSIEHLNLVKLIGYMEDGNERILVVEYISNGNLREHLDCARGVTLDLAMRLDILVDVAHALTYLHVYADQPIIHRDVKSSNILLTENFRAKVADFGYSRMGPLDLDATHVSTKVKGTTGYLDPEYLKTLQLTQKSDVYSFGVLLLETITGRRPIEPKKKQEQRITIQWVFKKFLDGKITEIIDTNLEVTAAACIVVERTTELAFKCSAPTRQDRPTMRKVVEILWDIRKDYQNFLQERNNSSPMDLARRRSSQELHLKSFDTIDISDRKGRSSGSN